MAGAITTYAGRARRRDSHVNFESAALAAHLDTVSDQWAFSGWAIQSLSKRGESQ